VITDDEVMRLFERADPARVDDPAPVIDAAGYLYTLRERSSNVTLIDTEPTPTRLPSRHRWPIITAAAAVVVLLVVGAVILAARDNATVPEIPADPPQTLAPATPAEEIASGFFQTYAAHDVDQAATYLTADAFTEFGGSVDGMRLEARWAEAQGYKLLLDSCQELETSPSGTQVRCTYAFHAIRSDEIGLGPYSGNYYDFTLLDGEIVSVESVLSLGEFSPQMWEPFGTWVRQTYPDDVAIMYTSASMQRISEESIPLWERHSREYVDHVTSSREEFTSQVDAICAAVSQRLAEPASPSEDQRAIDDAAIVEEGADELRALPRPPSTDLTGYTDFYRDLYRLARLIVDDPQGEYLELRRQLNTAVPLLQPCLAALPM
jgi:hypothetical protein